MRICGPIEGLPPLCPREQERQQQENVVGVVVETIPRFATVAEETVDGNEPLKKRLRPRKPSDDSVKAHEINFILSTDEFMDPTLAKKRKSRKKSGTSTIKNINNGQSSAAVSNDRTPSQ